MSDMNFRHGVRAEVILDSISERGHRLTTMEVTLHRFVLAELNTHRKFSRNSSSSRAIPFWKQVERVKYHPAIPVSFPAEQRGMQGGEEVEVSRRTLEGAWLLARDEAVKSAEFLALLGVHKSVVSRLLEPFMWQTVIISSTEWENFFALRAHPDAQPEIRVAAEAMQQAYNSSEPVLRGSEQWHLPYISEEDWIRGDLTTMMKVSAARCARVSYLTHDGIRDLNKDIELYERLVSADPPHDSPLEHVATPAHFGSRTVGNFDGWHQLRHVRDWV